MPRYMTTAEVAALCRTHLKPFVSGATSAKARWVKLGRKVLYDAEAVETWLTEAQQEGSAERRVS